MQKIRIPFFKFQPLNCEYFPEIKVGSSECKKCKHFYHMWKRTIKCMYLENTTGGYFNGAFGM